MSIFIRNNIVFGYIAKLTWRSFKPSAFFKKNLSFFTHSRYIRNKRYDFARNIKCGDTEYLRFLVFYNDTFFKYAISSHFMYHHLPDFAYKLIIYWKYKNVNRTESKIKNFLKIFFKKYLTIRKLGVIINHVMRV